MGYKGMILDLEGTLTSSWTPIPGAMDFLNFLVNRNIPFRIVTNTVSKSTEDFTKMFHEFGMDIPRDMFVNPYVVLNSHLNKNNTNSYFFVGTDFMKINISRQPKYDGIPEYVVLFDFERIECNYELLNRIFIYLINGAKLITASNSEFYLSNGEPRIDTGAFARMYEIITKQNALVMGKPSNAIYATAAEQMGMLPSEIISVGDDIRTDIKGGREFGAATVLVKTGKYMVGDETLFEPDRIIDGIMELTRLF